MGRLEPPMTAGETWSGKLLGFHLGRTVSGLWWAWSAGCGASHYRTPVGALLVVAAMRLRRLVRR